MTTVLVTTATGQIGSALVPMLAERGTTVRAMTRRTPAPGVVDARAEVAVADLDDTGSLRAALDGVDALFLNTPSSQHAAEQQIRAADLAAAAAVRRVVLLSQLAADEDSPVRFLRWHARVERHLGTLPLEVVVLRPNLFLQGLLAIAPAIREHGTLGAPIGDARISMVDTRDIAAVAATVLLDDGHAGAVHTLTGPAAVTHTQAARAIAAATGTPVEFRDLSEARFAAVLDGVLPAWQIDGLLEDYAHYRRGEAAAVDPAVPEILGRPALDLAAFARHHRRAFGG
ncbi:NmrA family NAD(P)-binding protein [Pseudonocardia sp. HH130630-07]|uniref:NmrA family NAD(P)-binding protein n=1 Tax=Pseudonocardia sp. HH130630-07 TaxID=1690815 RepID=UPI00081537B5|nr:NmrA family NAD(P)-binding protein [Pseudonocardia sp. HH130630-07]ANY08463.1 NAD(P)-dependent oxidoreductase [Pseudonocardia sp. HH130630-07]